MRSIWPLISYTNASHAMTIMRSEDETPGGVLTVSTERQRCDKAFRLLHPDARPEGNCILIRVSDNGVGMNEETRLQIFDPFFSTKGQQEGTGLGLAMAYGIVTQHRGFIQVDSEPGKGSTFHVFLPAMEENETDRIEGARIPNIIAGSGGILVIDDETALLHIARGMLEACGYEVICAQDGETGVEIYRREHDRIQGVLLDLSMPGMSGLEVFERIRKIDPGLRVLLSSGFMEDRDRLRAAALGLKRFIQKPYRIEELSAKIKEVLGE